MNFDLDPESGNEKKIKIKDSHLLWRPLDKLNIGVIGIMMVMAFSKIFTRPEYILVTAMLGLVLFLLLRINRFYENQGNVKNNYRWHIGYQIVLIIFIIHSFFMFTPNDSIISFNTQLNALDAFIFGRTPALYLEPLLTPIGVDFFFLIYYGFYLTPLIFVFRLYSRRRKDDLKLTYLAMSSSLYLVLAGYFIFPATGPSFLMDSDFNNQVQGFYLTNIVPGLRALIEPTQFNAFPSIHAAGSLVLLLLSFKVDRYFFWAFLPFAIMIQFSCIYLRYSFGISLLAGYVFGFLAYTLSNGIFTSRKKSLTIVDNKTKSF